MLAASGDLLMCNIPEHHRLEDLLMRDNVQDECQAKCKSHKHNSNNNNNNSGSSSVSNSNQQIAKKLVVDHYANMSTNGTQTSGHDKSAGGIDEDQTSSNRTAAAEAALQHHQQQQQEMLVVLERRAELEALERTIASRRRQLVRCELHIKRQKHKLHSRQKLAANDLSTQNMGCIEKKVSFQLIQLIIRSTSYECLIDCFVSFVYV